MAEERNRDDATAELAAAYNLGWRRHLCHPAGCWEHVEPELAAEWRRVRETKWRHARAAAAAGWHHADPRSRRRTD